MTTFDPSQELLTRQQVAEIAKMSVATVDRARYRGDLEEEGSPGLVRIRRAALDRWLKKRGQERNGRDDG
jgi:hypothetical protein